MSSSKISLLLLPLLVSILLSTLSNLKVGKALESALNYSLSPILFPLGQGRAFITQKVLLIKNAPSVYKENQNLSQENTSLKSENQTLKDLLSENKITHKYNQYQIVPIRITRVTNLITATTNQDFTQIAKGQPVVSGSNLIGFVDQVKAPIIEIVPLDSDSCPTFPVRTSSNQIAKYSHENRISIISDIPSVSQINLNDTIFTEASPTTPANLVIGTIKRIISSPQEPIQKAEINLESSFSNNPSDLVIITKP